MESTPPWSRPRSVCSSRVRSASWAARTCPSMVACARDTPWPEERRRNRSTRRPGEDRPFSPSGRMRQVAAPVEHGFTSAWPTADAACNPRRGSCGSARRREPESTFLRRRVMKISTVRVSYWWSRCQTRSQSSVRENTRPGSCARTCSRSNSRGESAIGFAAAHDPPMGHVHLQVGRPGARPPRPACRRGGRAPRRARRVRPSKTAWPDNRPRRPSDP